MPHAVSDGNTSRLKPTWEDMHPWLLSAIVIVSLGAQNTDWFSLNDVLSMLGPVLLPATVVFLVLLFFRRSARHAALMTSWISLLGFYYGEIFDGFANIPAGGGVALRHGVLIAIGVGVTALIWHLTGELRSLARFVSLVAAITLTAVSTKFGLILAREPRLPAMDLATASSARPEESSEETGRPDIYYIILDAYGRGDVLQKYYDFDNSEFLDGLRQRGFYVADKSCTNYPGTAFSLSSSLNMRFHESFTPQGGYKSLAQMLRNHEVGRSLRERGYQLIHFNTSFVPTSCSEISHVSLGEPATWLSAGSRMLTIQLIRHSVLRFFNGGDRGILAAQHRRAFRQLAEVPMIPGPKFTFCHLVTPHAPFVFTRDGQAKWDIDQGSGKSYTDQIFYLNQEVLRAIDAIRVNSAVPPVIIVQSDHGPGYNASMPGADPLEGYVQERVPILNAYLVPHEMRNGLYPTITPVNTFRLLLSKCFGFDYEPLPDRKFMVNGAIWPNILEISDKVHDGIPDPGVLSPAVVSRVNSMAKQDARTRVE